MTIALKMKPISFSLLTTFFITNSFSLEQKQAPFSELGFKKEIIEKIKKNYDENIEGQIPLSFEMAKYAGGERTRKAFDHSLIKPPRENEDKKALVDVWKYSYKDPKSGKILCSKKPLASSREFWKSDKEARIISMTFYGKVRKYFEGLKDYIASIENLKKENTCLNGDGKIGYDTFTFRVYVAARKPGLEPLGELENGTDPKFISELLDSGCEVAYVDNHLKKVGKDATFWRFLVLDEKMGPKEKIRYLLRDVDHKLTAAEAFAVGEWTGSQKKYHRMHFSPVAIGPLVASIFGGTHEGDKGHKHMKEKIENFPYRYVYGDDEIFTKNIIWEDMKKSGSILTHKYPRGLSSKYINPYPRSLEEPTSKFVQEALDEEKGNGEKGKNCAVDVYMPKGLPSPVIYLGYDVSLKDFPKRLFKLDLKKKRIAKALSGYYKNTGKLKFDSEMEEAQEDCSDNQDDDGLLVQTIESMKQTIVNPLFSYFSKKE